MLKIEQKFSSVENASFKKDVMGENASRNTPLNRNKLYKRRKSSAQQVAIIKFDNEELASLPKKMVWTEECTRPRKMMTRKAKGRLMAVGCRNVTR